MSKVRVGALESFDHSPFLSTGLPSLEVRIDDRRTGDWFGSICSVKESDKEGYCTGRMGMEFQAPGWCQKSQHFRGCKLMCNSPVKAIKVMIDAIENAESEGIAGDRNGKTRAVDWVILNVDGCSKGNPRAAGAGGLIGDCLGSWTRGFAINTGICSSVKAELRAVITGSDLACSLGNRHPAKLDSVYVFVTVAE